MDVHAATRRLSPWLPPTPLRPVASLDAWLKLETEQPTGSYKVRGALHALLVRTALGDRRPVVAASAGNHGQAVAWAARQLGLAAWVVVPEGAPAAKIAGAMRLGASVATAGDSFEAAMAHAERLAHQHDAELLHPFDDPRVIAGQASLGLELDAGPGDEVWVPIGGGGLAAGSGLALADTGARVIGVQIAGVDAMARALAGRPTRDRLPPTIADGVRVRVPGRLTQAICAVHLDELVVVDEGEVRAAMRALWTHARIVAEGAGALALAGALRLDHRRPHPRRRIVVISGANIDRERWLAVIDDPPSPSPVRPAPHLARPGQLR